MGLVYLFALVVGLGTLLVQIGMGGKDADGDHGDHALGDGHGADADAHADGDADGHDASADGHDADAHDGGSGKDLALADGHHGDGEASALTLFLSTRFWIFAALAFGMTGSLIHWLALAGTVATAIIAGCTGFGSGLMAVLAFRAVKRSANSSTGYASDAVGQVGRVIVDVEKGRMGKVRVELKGHSVDMLAITDESDLARGDAVLIEDVDGEVVRVSKRPPELG